MIAIGDILTGAAPFARNDDGSNPQDVLPSFNGAVVPFLKLKTPRWIVTVTVSVIRCTSAATWPFVNEASILFTTKRGQQLLLLLLMPVATTMIAEEGAPIFKSFPYTWCVVIIAAVLRATTGHRLIRHVATALIIIPMFVLVGMMLIHVAGEGTTWYDELRCNAVDDDHEQDDDSRR